MSWWHCRDVEGKRPRLEGPGGDPGVGLAWWVICRSLNGVLEVLWGVFRWSLSGLWWF